jgi:Uma2 family endonuclease
VRLPDISFISVQRMKAGGGIKQPIPSLISDLAIEILSPANRPGEMRRKREEYFAAGVRLVWIIDPKTRSADVYTDVDQLTRVDRAGMLDGNDALPGFAVNLAELFQAADEACEGMI